MRKFNKWSEASEYLCRYNREHGIKSKGCAEYICEMVAVITEDSFDQEYSLESRSYVFTNDNKAFIDGMGGYSIFANSLDGSDPGVRLERYLEDEGNPGGWKVDYCYIKSED